MKEDKLGEIVITIKTKQDGSISVNEAMNGYFSPIELFQIGKAVNKLKFDMFDEIAKNNMTMAFAFLAGTTDKEE